MTKYLFKSQFHENLVKDKLYRSYDDISENFEKKFRIKENDIFEVHKKWFLIHNKGKCNFQTKSIFWKSGYKQ